MVKKLGFLLSLALLISGCGNLSQSSNSPDQQPEVEVAQDWLNTSNDSIELRGKAAYDTLVPDYDGFVNTAYLNLPKKLQAEARIGGPDIEFSLIGTDENGPFKFNPVVLISYGGKDWLFIESLYLKFGTDVKEFISEDQAREVINGYTVEYIPIKIEGEESVLFLSKVFELDNVEARFGGSKQPGADDRFLTEKEIKGLKTVLLAYRYMYQNDMLTTVPNS